MRLGGTIFKSHNDPDSWVAAVQSYSYRAASCPIGPGAGDAQIRAYANAAERADIVIAEVGAWSNPLSPNPEEAEDAVAKCKACLALADQIGACCCVNIAGSRGERWDGPDAANFTDETFDRIVVVVRDIIDAVNPTHTYYTLETMPCMYPDSADNYLRLLHAIDRKRFAVHLDPTNLICSPQRYYQTGAVIRDCFEKLGGHIKSCHAKDIILHPQAMCHLDEIRPGKGNLDYRVYLSELNKLHPDTPILTEHMGEEDSRNAAIFIREVAAEQAIAL